MFVRVRNVIELMKRGGRTRSFLLCPKIPPITRTWKLLLQQSQCSCLFFFFFFVNDVYGYRRKIKTSKKNYLLVDPVDRWSWIRFATQKNNNKRTRAHIHTDKHRQENLIMAKKKVICWYTAYGYTDELLNITTIELYYKSILFKTNENHAMALWIRINMKREEKKTKIKTKKK